MKKKVDSKKQKILVLCTIFISVILVVYSLINIVIWFIDNYNIKKQSNLIEENVVVSETKDIEIKDEEKMIDEKELTEADPYWNLIKMDYLEVDFSNLIKENSEVVAWICVAGTNINYPVVQHLDNKYYLNHSFNGSKNAAGWIFLDYRNSIQELNKNTIIYGHTRKDDSMFGSLKNILKSDWYENTNNYIIKVSTIYENNLWQVFSAYKIPTTSDYIQTNFSDDDEFLEFLDKIKQRSVHDFKTTVSTNNKVLTLSTCYNEKERLVLHAKLIKSKKIKEN